jgi:citrate synthase
MAKLSSAPVTKIGSPTNDTSRIELRGRDLLSDLLGKMTFSQAFYLAVTGRDAGPTETCIMDAALVVLMDHGLTPTALVARLVADSLADQPQVAIGAGVMLIGDKFVGTMVGAAKYLADGVGSIDTVEYARKLVADFTASGRRLPGFGHPYYHPTDPRTSKLFAIAQDAGVNGRYIALLKKIDGELERAHGKRITCNVTAALGALLCEIDFPLIAMRGLAVVSRAAGLTAHVAEEITTGGIANHLMEVAGKIAYEA